MHFDFRDADSKRASHGASEVSKMLQLLVLLRLLDIVSGAQNVTSHAKPVIIDTDIMTDCDDVGALAIANVLHNCGLCDLQAAMINTHSRYGALAASAINTYFGNGHVPIAALRPLNDETFFDRRTFLLSDFASKVAHNFPRTLNTTEQAKRPLDLYRKVLGSAEDNSVTIISIGFLTNLANLLDAPGGPELLASKTRELVIMGGRYPSGWEYNFGGVDPESARKVVGSWPKSVPVTYSGYELGKTILSGQYLREHAPAASPVLAAYEWYNGRCSTTRESWDPLTVLYGILGLDGFSSLGLQSPFAYANKHGYNSITSLNASNAWIEDEAVNNQHWLRLAEGVTNDSMASLLTLMYAHDPADHSCFGLARDVVDASVRGAGQGVLNALH